MLLSKLVAGLLVGLSSGLFAPDVVTAALSAPHCTAGCRVTFATKDNDACASISISFALLSGHMGECRCEGVYCQEDLGCLLDAMVTFAPSVPGTGCVYDRAPGGGSWGQTGFITNITGCNAFGGEREVAFSSSCDPVNDVDCKATILTYCSKCDGRCP